MSDKIGILTFHDAINFGAALQAYASQEFLNENGIHAEIIDYRCERFKNNYKVLKIYDHSLKGLLKAIAKIPVIYKRNHKFHTFQKTYLHVSDVVYDTNTIVEANKVYKSFITGSDQIWNLSLTGHDTNYLLTFVTDPVKKNSYAASMGSTNLDAETVALYRKYLHDFSHISVREKDAGEFLSDVLEKPIPVVLDPVFLLDRNQWFKVSKTPEKKGYILVYCLHEKDVYLCAERLARLTGLKIICIQNAIKKTIVADYVLNADPSEFLGYVKNAEYVVTDSFHGTAFGIIFRKQIKVVLKKKIKGLNNRILTLLEDFDLMNSIVTPEADNHTFLQEISFNEECIEAKISESRAYLTDISEARK